MLLLQEVNGKLIFFFFKDSVLVPSEVNFLMGTTKRSANRSGLSKSKLEMEIKSL